MTFNKWTGLALALVMGTGLAAKADTLADIEERGTLICGMSSASPPWGFLDTETQEIVGYEIDLCRMVAERLGVELELKEVSAAARVPELVQGRVDMLATLLTYSKARAEQVDFSGAYIREGFNFMVLEESGIASVDELDGQRIGVVSGSFLEPLIPQRLPEARVVAFDSQPANFMALQQGKVRGSAMRYSQAKAIEAAAGPNARPLVALPGALTVGASGFGVRKDDERWRDYLNAFLQELEANGEGQALFDKWLGEDSVYKMEREFAFGEPLS